MSKRAETSSDESKVIDVRIDAETLRRIEACHKAGAFRNKPRATFLGYLVEIAINRYEAKILPEERGGSDVIHGSSHTLERVAK